MKFKVGDIVQVTREGDSQFGDPLRILSVSRKMDGGNTYWYQNLKTKTHGSVKEYIIGPAELPSPNDIIKEIL